MNWWWPSFLRRKPATKVAVYTLRADQDKLNQLRVIATKSNRSLSQQLRWMIEQAIEKSPQEDVA